MSSRNGMKKTKRATRAQPKLKKKIRVNLKVVQRQRSQRPPRSQSSSAPAAVSTSRKMTFSYAAGNLGGRSTLRVRATIPLCEIGNDAFNNGLFIQNTAGAFTATNASINPYTLPLANSNATVPTDVLGSSWISPHLPLLALAFDRYKMDSLCFHYEPQSTTTVADRLVFAWTDDPIHPFLAPSSGAAVIPTQLDLLVTQDSMAFAPWKAWDLTVPVAKDSRFLFANGVSDSGQRLTDFGAFSCVGSAAPVDPILYGILYASVVLDLFDPVPIVSALSLPLLLSARTAKLVRTSDNRHAGEEKKTRVPDDPDWDEASAPKWTAAPSGVPGGSLYAPSASSVPTPPPTPKVTSRK